MKLYNYVDDCIHCDEINKNPDSNEFLGICKNESSSNYEKVVTQKDDCKDIVIFD